MKVVFVANYLSPHQLPFCLEMNSHKSVEFYFIATLQVSDDRKKLGYKDLDHEYPFVVCAYDNQDEYEKGKLLINEADIVIVGKAPWKFVRDRVKKSKIVFRYSERQLKRGFEIKKFLFRYIRWHAATPKNKPCYLLCASAYTAFDFSLFGLYKNKAFKWGYFPETKEYENIDSLIHNKNNNILWVGRLLDWKRPDYVVKIAKKLKEKGYTFEVNIIGTGPMEKELQTLIFENNLEDNVHLLGAMESHKVREYMEQSSIFVFTSNRQEGWGAVLNEAMNSGCAVVASDIIGSAPFLISDGINGMLFHHNDENSCVAKVEQLLTDKSYCNNIGKQAYLTIVSQWNAKNAANRFVKLCDTLLNGQNPNMLFDTGICSVADIIKDNWEK